MEKKKKKKWFYNILLLIAGAVFVFSAIKIGTILYQYYQQDSEQDKMVKIAKVPDDPEKEKFSVDWKKLKETNPDIIGWIMIPDTNISYAMVQGKDNSYYLTHTAENTELYTGAIFMDAGAKADYSDRNTIIYGHNILYGTMFAQLEKFKEQDFFNAHPYIYIFTPEKNYRCEVLTMFTTTDSSNVYTTNFQDDAAYLNYVNEMRQQSDHQSKFEMSAQDRMIMLSTCSYEKDGQPSELRYVMHAKLVEWKGSYEVEKK